MKGRHLIAVTVLFAVQSIFSSAFGQYTRLQSEREAEAGLSFELWKADEDQVMEISLPITIVYPRSDKLKFYAMTAPAFTNLNTGTSASLTGLSDLKLGGHCLTLNDQLLVTFAVNLPVGKNALDTDEYSAASVLTMPAFRFRVPSLGQGFDAQVGLSTAREVGDFIIGGGLSYLLKGGYQPFAGYRETYHPGDEITLTGGLNRAGVTADMIYTIYFHDTWGGEKIFQSGNKLALQVQYSHRFDPFELVLFAREAFKAKNKTGDEEVFSTERKNTNANQFEMQGRIVYPVNPDMRLTGVVESILYSNNDYGTGGASLLGFGGGVEFRFQSRILFKGDTRFYFGNIKSGQEKTDALGFKLFGGIDYTL